MRKRVVEDLKPQGLLERDRHPRPAAGTLRPLQDPHRALSCPTSGSSGWATTPMASPGFAQQAMDAVTAGRVQDPPRALRQELPRLAGREARLVHQPPALVGAPDPDLDLRRPAPRPIWSAPSRPRRRLLEPERDRRLADLRRDRAAPAMRSDPRPRLDPGSRRPRHLVQLGSLAPLDARLARANTRARQVLSHERPLDGPRHHHALGGPDGDLRPVQHGRRAVPATSTSTR